HRSRWCGSCPSREPPLFGRGPSYGAEPLSLGRRRSRLRTSSISAARPLRRRGGLVWDLVCTFSCNPSSRDDIVGGAPSRPFAHTTRPLVRIALDSTASPSTSMPAPSVSISPLLPACSAVGSTAPSTTLAPNLTARLIPHNTTVVAV